ncbi:MAG: hypothetical protein U0269_27695 [Polyangiales bacterium]
MLPVPPTISFEIAPTVAVPGEPLTVIVHFHCDEPVEHRGVALRWLCTESRRGSLLPTREVLSIHFDREKFFYDSLPAGDSTFEWTVTVPHNTPPSFDDGRTIIELRLSAHVDIAWSPDAHEERAIRVQAPMPKPLPELPPSFATPIGYEGPIIEMAYSPEYLVAGASFECGVAPRGFSRTGIDSIELRLIALCEERDRDATRESVVSEWTVARQHVDDGAIARLSAKLDAPITGDFLTNHTRLRHELEATVRQRNGVIEALRAPCVVLEQPFGTDLRPRPLAMGATKAPTVEALVESKLASLLAPERDAESPAQGALGPLFGLGITVNSADESVRWVHRGTRVELRPDRHPALGPCTRVTLEYAPLGIGLSMKKRALLDRGTDLVGFSPAFASKYAIALRSRTQMNLFLAAVLEELACAYCADCTMNDEALIAWIPRIDQEQPELDRAIEAAVALVDRVQRARREIKVPAALDQYSERWSRFAAKKSAQFTVGDASIRRWFIDGVELSLVHAFDAGEPTGVELRASAPRACTDEDAQQISAALARSTVVARDEALVVQLALTHDPATHEELARALATAVRQHFSAHHGAYR